MIKTNVASLKKETKAIRKTVLCHSSCR